MNCGKENKMSKGQNLRAKGKKLRAKGKKWFGSLLRRRILVTPVMSEE